MTVGAVDQGTARLLERRLCRYSQVSRLAAGVDAGIRAAGAVHPHASAEDPGQGFLDDLLDAERIVLALPAGVVRADIGDPQAVLHGRPARIRPSTTKTTSGGSQTAP